MTRIASGSPPSDSMDQYLQAMRSHWQIPKRPEDILRGPSTHDLMGSQFFRDPLLAARAKATEPTSLLLGGEGYRVVLGSYRILEQLGAGGMGQVYKAEHLIMKRLVALKIIACQELPEHEAIDRFQREVQISALFSHPNIVIAHDAGCADDFEFLVMEYVDGVELAWLVRELGTLPIPLACECAKQAALGLQHAFERGMMHGDIKPANLLILRQVAREPADFDFTVEHGICPPMVKILDFGLARQLNTTLHAETTSHPSSSQEGCAGTPDFMPPEHGREGALADIRGDIYSLGCTLYYLLTGQVPYPGGTWNEKLLRHQFDPAISAREIRPEISPELELVLHRMMAKEKSDRYARPLDVVRALQNCQTHVHQPRSSMVLRPSELGIELTETNEGTLTPAGSSMELSSVPGFEPTVSEPVLPPLPSTPPHPAMYRSAPEPLTQRRRLARWPFLVVLAIAGGLWLAWTARPWLQEMLTHWNEVEQPPKPFAGHFRILRLADQPFVDLKHALAMACDRDVLEISGPGPYRIAPVELHGKRIHIRAASGSRPRLELARPDAEMLWQPMLQTDRDLTLEDVDLAVAGSSPKDSAAGTTHLVFSTGGNLRLVRCRLSAPHGQGLVVGRGVASIELVQCQLQAASAVVCFEVGRASGPTLSLSDCKLTLHDPDGAALCIWSNPSRISSNVHLKLEGNTIQAGRIVAADGLEQGLDVQAENNRFTFQQALLSMNHQSDRPFKTESCHWQGRNNQYTGGEAWLVVDGKDRGIYNLKSWLEHWQASEPGSTDRAPSYAQGSAWQASIP